jgi:gamma-glutamylcyclotransferase (GGCT)/AIG2-like uncharacterized protein YtfP
VTDLLFVYGSLRSEFDNPHVWMLREQAESMGHATVPGSIFLVGQYPGYRREPAGIVHGELWRLRDPAKTLAALDEYEGGTYLRELIDDAWIYVHRGEVLPHQRIASGDFLVR